jgi:hypothetical protein
MKIIESDIELQNVEIHPNSVQLIVPIWASPKGHECMFNISFYYIRTTLEEYIINMTHIDAECVSKVDIHKYVNSETLVLNNRYLNTIGLDYEYVYFEHNNTPFNLREFSSALYTTYRGDFVLLNDCIPLMKWIELLRGIEYISERKSWYYNYSNHINTLGKLEGAGVHVDREKFIDTFGLSPVYITKDDLVFTKYNPYTITGRPSNHHLGINWAALNKSDGSRKCITSRFGEDGSLIQFDFESYHLRIIAKMAGFAFPENETDLHQYFADQYGVDRETSKGITFKYLYGSLDDAALTIPFFKHVDDWMKTMWGEFCRKEKLVTLFDGREIPKKLIDNPTQQKVFNYLLQAMETEINYKKLSFLMHRMKVDGEYRSKPILYTYDAFLVDVHKDERDKIIDLFVWAMSMSGFPVKISEGKNYDELTLLK